jgi:hypothetical protein
MVKSRRFPLGYKVDDVGPSGVGGVDLFITQDQGRKWWRYGEDPDRVSPIDVEVPQDGEYGFAIRARSGVGLTLDPPLPGEPPAIVVIVDQVPPAVELFPIQQGQGSQINHLLIRWRASDLHPVEQSVMLSYALQPNGPWEPVSSWIVDTGSWEWIVPPGAPPQFYVRVQVRDAAGNVGQAISARPVVVDLARPSARFVDTEPRPK